MPGLGQEHARIGQEQCNSRAGALYLYFLPVSAPMQYFVGRSRAGAGKGPGRSRAAAGQDSGRVRAGAKQEQEQGRRKSPIIAPKFYPCLL